MLHVSVVDRTASYTCVLRGRVAFLFCNPLLATSHWAVHWAES